ncbi:ATP-binding protein [Geobacter sp. 60473]|uniref:ATP-binding protein n=1 Tax=Geobacter sp. 60473 TaxID=3080755 RepID=UPI0030C77E3A
MDATYLGAVRKVTGSKVLVEISTDVPSSNPIIDGRVHRLGQIGSFVRIPVGYLNLYGIVSMVGASEAKENDDEYLPSSIGQRWLEIQLVGEAYGNEEFQRGVSIFPTLDDEVHIVTEDDLSIIYAPSGESTINIGTLAASESLKAYININKLVTRHSTIVGSTGSGKSNTVAALLKALTAGEFPSSRVVVIDPHGEYGAALGNFAKVFSIGNTTNPLIIPYWAMSFDELAWFLVDKKSANETAQDLRLRDAVYALKKEQCGTLRAGAVNEDSITSDSPIPFSLKQVWYEFDRELRVTYNDNARTEEALVSEGNAELLEPASFLPHGAGSTPPHKPLQGSLMGPYVNRLISRLKDKRFDFLLNPREFDGTTRDLNDLLESWVGHEKPITVLDFGGIPSDLTDLIVGVLTRVLYEGMYWGRDIEAVGRTRPLLVVFEEAHSYLPKGGSSQFVAGYASQSVRRILKEGRKYGIGALVVSQRPAELDETILSQCGTFIALRLTNAEDQSRVKATVPDTLASLVDLLPALRTGEAIVLGEATQIPSRIRLPLIEPRPNSDDPKVVECWKKEKVTNANYDQAITSWRNQSSQVNTAQEGV